MLQRSPIGLIAGNGDLPLAFLESAQRQGYELVAFAVTKSAYSALKGLCRLHRFSPVEVKQILSVAKAEGVEELTFIGKVPKLEFFKSLHKMDLKLLERMYRELKDFSDDSLHYAISKIVGEYGLKIADQTKFLRELFPSQQVFSQRQPTEEELESVRFGLGLAKAIGGLDLGQTVVVQNRSALAVEAIEGTDQCIKRARKLIRPWSKNKNIIVCKASKPNQDQRFDVPTVGLNTLKSAGANSIVAFEANETFFLNQESAINYADRHNICLIAL